MPASAPGTPVEGIPCEGPPVPEVPAGCEAPAEGDPPEGWELPPLWPPDCPDDPALPWLPEGWLEPWEPLEEGMLLGVEGDCDGDC